MPQYWLSQHVHLCMTVDHLVILDLKHDRYMALPKDHAEQLAPHVHGWPVQPDGPNLATDTAASLELLAALEQRELLTQDPARGKLANLPLPSPADAVLVETILLHTLDKTAQRPPSVRVLDVVRFSIAYFMARRTLRSNTLEARVQNLLKRKNAAARPSSDLDDLKRRVVTFRLLRPFFYTSREKCLQDALVLTEFLARYGHFPSWVFGVRTRPFSAHCWVQTDAFVLNDVPEHVGTFTPIMSI